MRSIDILLCDRRDWKPLLAIMLERPAHLTRRGVAVGGQFVNAGTGTQLLGGPGGGVDRMVEEVLGHIGLPLIRASVTIDFRSEALVNEVLEAGIRLEWIGNRSFGFTYRVWEQASGRTVIEASTVQVCYDYGAKQTIPMPEELRRSLASFEGRALPGKP